MQATPLRCARTSASHGERPRGAWPRSGARTCSTPAAAVARPLAAPLRSRGVGRHGFGAPSPRRRAHGAGPRPQPRAPETPAPAVTPPETLRPFARSPSSPSLPRAKAASAELVPPPRRVVSLLQHRPAWQHAASRRSGAHSEAARWLRQSKRRPLLPRPRHARASTHPTQRLAPPRSPRQSRRRQHTADRRARAPKVRGPLLKAHLAPTPQHNAVRIGECPSTQRPCRCAPATGPIDRWLATFAMRHGTGCAAVAGEETPGGP
mmetsp:Transcript_43701/g.125040  ORF Transcript_43701/g.125040 Transcript_43701/m.125040 type:complete len:264 (-) Transcript_43701:354-1145(-)